jgi:hypothetical protein
MEALRRPTSTSEKGALAASAQQFVLTSLESARFLCVAKKARVVKNVTQRSSKLLPMKGFRGFMPAVSSWTPEMVIKIRIGDAENSGVNKGLKSA